MKKLLALFMMAVMAVSMMAEENYRIDSVYHYYSFDSKPVVSKTIYHYNAAGQKTQSFYQYLQAGKWSKGHITNNYEYNAKGLLSKSTEINEYNNSTSYSQKVYSYKDTLVILIESRHKKDTAEWQTTRYEEFEYNNQNLLVRHSWMNSKMEKRKRYQYLYDPAGNKIQHDIYEWIEGEFIPSVRNMYVYDEYNKMIQEKCYIADELREQIMYEYDSNHFLVQRIQYLKHDGILQPVSKETYVNNSKGQAVKSTLYSNMDFKGVFILGSERKNTYDAMGNLTSKTHMGYFQGTWYPLSDSDERWIYYFVPVN